MDKNGILQTIWIHIYKNWSCVEIKPFHKCAVMNFTNPAPSKDYQGFQPAASVISASAHWIYA